jgi:hypothetical protein
MWFVSLEEAAALIIQTRHPELVSGSYLSAAESKMLKQVQHDGNRRTK